MSLAPAASSITGESGEPGARGSRYSETDTAGSAGVEVLASRGALLGPGTSESERLSAGGSGWCRVFLAAGGGGGLGPAGRRPFLLFPPGATVDLGQLGILVSSQNCYRDQHNNELGLVVLLLY